MKIRKRTSMLHIILIPILLTGCLKSELNLTIRFDGINGLETDDRVIFEGNSIGKVNRVSYSAEGKYLVEISIQPDFKNTATEHSEFFIAKAPGQDRQKAVEERLSQKGGKVLADGSIVEGTGKPVGFLGSLGETIRKEVDELKDGLGKGVDELTDGLGKGVEEFRKDIDELTEGLGRVPESEEFRQFREEMGRLAGEMKRSGKEVREKLRNEFLPGLRSEMEKLRKKLRDLGREDEMKQMEKEIEKLRNI